MALIWTSGRPGLRALTRRVRLLYDPISAGSLKNFSAGLFLSQIEHKFVSDSLVKGEMFAIDARGRCCYWTASKWVISGGELSPTKR